MAEISDLRIRNIKKRSRYGMIFSAGAAILGSILLYLYAHHYIEKVIFLYIGAVIVVWGPIILLFCIILSIIYGIKLGGKSESEGYMVSRELDDPETVHFKECSTYVTPNYLLTLSTNPRYIRISDIVWVYEVSPIIQTFLRMTFLRVRKRNGKTVTMAELAIPSKYNSDLLNTIMEMLQERNPNIKIGYTKELKGMFKKASAHMNNRPSI